MHALKVYVDDSVFDKVMSFLKNLPAHQVKVDIEPTTRSNSPKVLKAVSLKTKGFTFNRDEANAR
jgi:hypothetical protein